MIYTASLSAQNTNVYLCDIVRRHDADVWLATCGVTGTFGGGTVTLGVSFDKGTTIVPLNQYATSTAASMTAASAQMVGCGDSGRNNDQPRLYASIGTATTPAIVITVADNR